MADLSLKLTAFEGPLDLLLHLIERDKVDIYDIPIAAVTEQYMSYLRSMSEFDMEVASDFLVMAATLLQIKSRMLLPKQSAEGRPAPAAGGDAGGIPPHQACCRCFGGYEAER